MFEQRGKATKNSSAGAALRNATAMQEAFQTIANNERAAGCCIAEPLCPPPRSRPGSCPGSPCRQLVFACAVALALLRAPSHFTEIEREREKKRRKFRFRRYNNNSGILIITIPTALHEALHLGLYDQYREQLVQNGKGRSWISIGPTILR
ncbi:uncharacterized protein B0T15DRAFT_123285 [Chaetomium strumarium]|uniref:Uncharacterized protein n=1 Tax=Chaetomium strumarium TaxID=1170767 RepID=A0AAJ0GZE3_9PEZI|nr:hypothetical protein B0T15DRAFT_123285 [Chaetomium strumarium]